MLEQVRAYDDINKAVTDATTLIEACERDLGRKLSRGECNDLLMDNTTWSRSAIVAVVDSIGKYAVCSGLNRIPRTGNFTQ